MFKSLQENWSDEKWLWVLSSIFIGITYWIQWMNEINSVLFSLINQLFFPAQSQFPFPPSFPPSPSPFSQSTHSLFTSEKWRSISACQPAMGNQVAATLGTSSPIKAGQGSLSGRKDRMNRQQRQRQSLFPLPGVTQEDQVTKCNNDSQFALPTR